MRRMRSRMIWTIGVLVWGAAAACASEPRTSSGTAVLMSPGYTLGGALATYARSASPTPSATPASAVPLAETPSTSTRYEVEATLNWTAHTLHVTQSVTYRNDTGRDQPTLIFNVDTNEQPDVFTLQRVTGTREYPVQQTLLEGTRLTVTLAEPLGAEAELTLGLTYDLAIPPIQDGYRYGHLGYWGYSAQQVNLGMWLPLLAACDGSGSWITPAYHDVGEYFVLRSADFTVDVRVVGAPDGLRVAGPGTLSRPNSREWHFELKGARDLTLSLSERYRVLTTTTETGDSVELYYLAEPEAESLDPPRHALHTAADALALYEDLYGPYPYGRLVVVEGDFPDGMEFSGLVFVSEDWFRAWTGVPNDWLTLITAHEVAHQWWYALVGNDQGQYPYLDEALAIYSEYLYVEHYFPEYGDWWWGFRVDSYTPMGYVDTSVYEFDSVRPYINAVYLRGAMMIQELRDDLGDTVFFAWLKTYASAMTGRVASPADLWRLLSPDAYKTTALIRSAFFRQVDVLAAPDSIP